MVDESVESKKGPSAGAQAVAAIVVVAGIADFLGATAEQKTLLGHQAVLYSDRTIALKFRLGGGKVDTGPGGIARSLVVARNVKDGGGSYEISIWRQDDVPPDDTALL